MSEERSSQQSLFTISALIALATILGGYFWPRGPLETLRPKEAHESLKYPRDSQDIEARLWQDPFEVVSRHQREEEDPGSSATRSIGALKGDIRGEDLLILIAIATGRPYADDHESRLRSRYAILSALGRAGYEPRNPEGIGCVKVIPGGWPPVQFTAPFEWFRQGQHPRANALELRKHVLLLWLTEQALGDKPLTALETFVDEVCGDRGLSCAGTAHVQVIGPRSSGTLKKMLDEIPPRDMQDDSARELPDKDARFTIRSPYATAEDFF